jgi:hypothetical protein
MLRKWSLIALLCTVPVLAQGPGQPEELQKQSGQVRRRLESLNWNPVTGKLTWTVSNGTKDSTGGYVPNHEPLLYEIDLSQATMSHNGSERRFSKEEAANVMTVMALISKYAQDSTVWWEAGKGEPVGTRVKFSPLSSAPVFRLLASAE